jgi:hypothetical protein
MKHEHRPMPDQIRHFLAENITPETLSRLLYDDAPHIRISQHMPTERSNWWICSIPLSTAGPNRRVSARYMTFDLELTLDDFRAWLPDFSNRGLKMVQSKQPLPADLCERNFRSESTYFNVLTQFGARLLLDLPFSVETASITIFQEDGLDQLNRTAIAYRKA